MPAQTKKATVIVPPREGFPGWWAAGKFWAAGTHDGAELTDDDIAALARRPGIVVLVGGKVARPEDTAVSTTSVQLTADEVAAIERFRADQQKKPTGGGPGYKLEKAGDRTELVDETMRQSGSNPALAQAPLQDSQVLHGEPPGVGTFDPTAGTGTVKPIEGGETATGNADLAAKQTEGAGSDHDRKRRR
jgi:hypothetical protein